MSVQCIVRTETHQLFNTVGHHVAACKQDESKLEIYSKFKLSALVLQMNVYRWSSMKNGEQRTKKPRFSSIGLDVKRLIYSENHRMRAIY